MIEVVAALMVLTFITASVLVVINRCMASAADSTLRLQAFEVARENMEKLLASDAVQQTVEYGNSDKYPDIKWETTVETFYEPITSRVWVRGICSAEFTDSAGEIQTIQLTHWLTDVTKQQLLELLKRQQQGQKLSDNQLIGTIEAAAEYAGVDVQTIEQWLNNGMLTTEEGSFIKNNIDIYKKSSGKPTPQAKSQQVQSVQDLKEPTTKPPRPDERKVSPAPSEQQTGPEGQTQPSEIEPTTGLPYEELNKMDFWELWQLLMEQKK